MKVYLMISINMARNFCTTIQSSWLNSSSASNLNNLFRDCVQNPRRSFHGERLYTSDIKKKLKVCFVHTPMSSVTVPGRDRFWTHFDERYYAVHPNLKPADAGIWELPHWMTWLAGVLKASGFENIRALDLYTAVDLTKGIDRDRMSAEIASTPADVYLFSPMTPNLHNAYDIASLIKSIQPGSINVFGGVVSTPLHDRVIEHPAVDFVVRDRGEYALPELLTRIEMGDSVKGMKNLTHKDVDGTVQFNPELYPYMDLSELPFPFVDLFPKEVGEKLRYIRQNYALGCPFTCSFCTIQTIGRKPGYFSTTRVIDEIKAYRAHYGEHHNIYFGDETFTLNTPKTLEICDALQREGNITYDIQTRLMSLNNQKVLKALYDSNCKWIEVGIETLSEKSAQIHKQGTNITKIEEMLRRLRDQGLPVCSFIVNGLPDQTPDEMRMSIDSVARLVDKQLLHATYYFGLVPYPGSEMYRNPEKFGMTIKSHDYRFYNEDIEPVYDTKHATSTEIYKVFQEGVRILGDAMSSTPYLGVPLSAETRGLLGKSLTHV